jgi:hypothetical protein
MQLLTKQIESKKLKSLINSSFVIILIENGEIFKDSIDMLFKKIEKHESKKFIIILIVHQLI